MAPYRLLEVCVDDPEGLAAAVAGGADRLELCGALSVGGLTPGPGLMAQAARAGVPVHAMVRVRAGDFTATPAELDAMRCDIDAVRAAGLAGVVFGVSQASGALDAGALEGLARHAEGLDLTLHRAFDLAPDRDEALETAVALGFSRILTSGGHATAEEGADEIAARCAQAAGRLVVMPGSGITARNVVALIAATGAAEVHASCSLEQATPAAVHAMGFAPPVRRVTSAAQVAALKAALSVAVNTPGDASAH